MKALGAAGRGGDCVSLIDPRTFSNAACSLKKKKSASWDHSQPHGTCGIFARRSGSPIRSARAWKGNSNPQPWILTKVVKLYGTLPCISKPINPTHILKNPRIILPSPEQQQPQNSINGLFEIQPISTLKLRDHDARRTLTPQ